MIICACTAIGNKGFAFELLRKANGFEEKLGDCMDRICEMIERILKTMRRYIYGCDNKTERKIS